MNDPTQSTADLLSQHTDWLRTLARSLVRDAALADDLTQDTLAIALERAPRELSSVRGWLGRVLTNRYREQERERAARVVREARAARKEGSLPPTDDLLERLQTEKRLADCLMELDEPYRSTVLLRFYEGLPPRKLAARMGLPITTVKSRLHRGLALLREKLDGEYGGDRRAWLVALAPWAEGFRPFPWMTTGGLAVNAKLLSAALIVVLCGSAFFLYEADEPVPDERMASAATPTSDTGGTMPTLGASESTDDSVRSPRRAVARTARPLGDREATEAVTYTVQGLVFDADGDPKSGLEIRFGDSEYVATTDARGRVELVTTDTSGSIDVADESWIAVRRGAWSAASELPAVLIVAPAIELSGRVVDGWGSDIPQARVRLVLPEDFEARFHQALDKTFLEDWATESSVDGAFTLARSPAVFGADLCAVHERFESACAPAPLVDSGGILIELGRARIEEGQALEGIVRTLEGDPAPGALVSMGTTTLPTDREGRFVMDLRSTGETQSITAALPGHLPATMERPESLSPKKSGWPDFVELVLGQPALTIQGRVVDEEGEPLEGGRVWVGDASDFGAVGTIPLSLEAVLAGGSVPSEAIDSLGARDSDESRFGSARPALEPNAIVHWVTTDADGRFELGGLVDRDYVLHVLDEEFHWGTKTDPIRAGTSSVTIEVPSHVYSELVGHVRTPQGDPIPGVRITPWIGAISVQRPVRGGTSDLLRFFLGKSTTTDDEGRFRLRDVPMAEVQFHLVSDAIVPSYASVDQVTDPGDFTIEVQGRVHLEVEVTPELADELRALDASGQIVQLLRMRADGYSHVTRVPLVDGRSGIVTVTTNVTDVELLREGEVVERISVDPKPGEPLEIVR